MATSLHSTIVIKKRKRVRNKVTPGKRATMTKGGPSGTPLDTHLNVNKERCACFYHVPSDGQRKKPRVTKKSETPEHSRGQTTPE